MFIAISQVLRLLIIVKKSSFLNQSFLINIYYLKIWSFLKEWNKSKIAVNREFVKIIIKVWKKSFKYDNF